MTKQKEKVRESAIRLLETIENNNAYSNLLINETIERNQYSNVDAGLLTELVYGTLQRKLTLDYYLAPFIKKQKKIEVWVKNLLRMSLYQKIYLTKIPEHAIIHEAVDIAKKRGHKGISSFVNGVLRNIQRQGVPKWEAIADPIEKIAIGTSHPTWLVKRWSEQFGLERTEAMCIENLTVPQQTARVNETLTSVEDVIKSLSAEGFQIEKSDHVPIAIKSVKGNLGKSAAFQAGFITIQDESSMLVGYAINPAQSETILDCCAAPGGKTTHIAEIMNNTGLITALDIHKHKIKLINENSSRLKLTNIESKLLDAKKVSDYFPAESFDRVLVDAPCSGLGVVRRKPDIKYTKTEADIEKLATIQLEILSTAAKTVKRGGLLVYSTCTVDKTENEGVANAFLKQHPEFAPDNSLKERMPISVQPFVYGNQLEILPQDLKSDGFYIACFQKKV